MAMNKSATENPNSASTRLVPNFVLLSSAFTQTPFVTLSKPTLVPTVSQKIIRDFHDSIVSTADNFLRFLHSLASQHPVFKKAVSLSSEFHTFCHQIRPRDYGNVKFPLLNHNFAAILPGDSVAGIVVANGVLNFLNIYNTLLIIRLVLTWFPNSPPAIVSPLSTVCDPYLNIFRGIIPPLGGTLDLSPILAFLVLNAFTSTASALPCELPPEGASPGSGSTRSGLAELTCSQKKWMKRLNGNQSKSSTDVD